MKSQHYHNVLLRRCKMFLIFIYKHNYFDLGQEYSSVGSFVVYNLFTAITNVLFKGK